MICPQCGEPCTQDMVDVGIGSIPCGPYGCENCHWVDTSAKADDDMLFRRRISQWRRPMCPICDNFKPSTVCTGCGYSDDGNHR